MRFALHAQARVKTAWGHTRNCPTDAVCPYAKIVLRTRERFTIGARSGKMVISPIETVHSGLHDGRPHALVHNDGGRVWPENSVKLVAHAPAGPRSYHNTYEIQDNVEACASHTRNAGTRLRHQPVLRLHFDQWWSTRGRHQHPALRNEKT